MKIDIVKTLITTFILVLMTVIVSFVPGLMVILTPLMLVPIVNLFIKSKNSYYVASVITVLFATLLLSTVSMVWITGLVLAGYLIGSLLNMRSSKERMLYVLTVFYSFYTLLAIIVFQMASIIPKVDVWFKDVTTLYIKLLQEEVKKGNFKAENIELFKTAMDMFMLQVPGLIIFCMFLLSLVQLLITMPLLRMFKVSTPNFRPLYMWHIPKITMYLYFIATIIKWGLTETDVVMLGIVTNLQYVLEWIIFIQGISLFHFFMKIRKTNILMNICIFILAFLLPSVTQIFGMLDMIFNMKSRIKRK